MLNREQELTNALIRLTTRRDVKAYFTQGHGERGLIRETRASFTSALSVLERDNYKVEFADAGASDDGTGRCIAPHRRGPIGGFSGVRD